LKYGARDDKNDCGLDNGTGAIQKKTGGGDIKKQGKTRKMGDERRVQSGKNPPSE